MKNEANTNDVSRNAVAAYYWDLVDTLVDNLVNKKLRLCRAWWARPQMLPHWHKMFTLSAAAATVGGKNEIFHLRNFYAVK